MAEFRLPSRALFICLLALLSIHSSDAATASRTRSVSHSRSLSPSSSKPASVSKTPSISVSATSGASVSSTGTISVSSSSNPSLSNAPTVSASPTISVTSTQTPSTTMVLHPPSEWSSTGSGTIGVAVGVSLGAALLAGILAFCVISRQHAKSQTTTVAPGRVKEAILDPTDSHSSSGGSGPVLVSSPQPSLSHQQLVPIQGVPTGSSLPFAAWPSAVNPTWPHPSGPSPPTPAAGWPQVGSGPQIGQQQLQLHQQAVAANAIQQYYAATGLLPPYMLAVPQLQPSGGPESVSTPTAPAALLPTPDLHTNQPVPVVSTAVDRQRKHRKPRDRVDTVESSDGRETVETDNTSSLVVQKTRHKGKAKPPKVPKEEEMDTVMEVKKELEVERRQHRKKKIRRLLLAVDQLENGEVESTESVVPPPRPRSPSRSPRDPSVFEDSQTVMTVCNLGIPPLMLQPPRRPSPRLSRPASPHQSPRLTFMDSVAVPMMMPMPVQHLPFAMGYDAMMEPHRVSPRMMASGMYSPWAAQMQMLAADQEEYTPGMSNYLEQPRKSYKWFM